MFDNKDYEKIVGFLKFFELETFSFEGFFPFKYAKKSKQNKLESFFTKINKGRIAFTQEQVLNNLDFNSLNGMKCSIDFDSIVFENIEDVEDEFIMLVKESKSFIDYYKTFMKNAISNWLQKINIRDLFEIVEDGTTLQVVPIKSVRIHEKIDERIKNLIFISFELVDNIPFAIKSKTPKNIDEYKYETLDFKINSHFTKIQFYDNQIETLLSRLDNKLK